MSNWFYLWVHFHIRNGVGASYPLPLSPRLTECQSVCVQVSQRRPDSPSTRAKATPANNGMGLRRQEMGKNNGPHRFPSHSWRGTRWWCIQRYHGWLFWSALRYLRTDTLWGAGRGGVFSGVRSESISTHFFYFYSIDDQFYIFD